MRHSSAPSARAFEAALVAGPEPVAFHVVPIHIHSAETAVWMHIELTSARVFLECMLICDGSEQTKRKDGGHIFLHKLDGHDPDRQPTIQLNYYQKNEHLRSEACCEFHP